MLPPLVDRRAELARLLRVWSSNRAECIPVLGRRRVGKTFLLEHFASARRHVYFRCQLAPTDEQLPQLGEALATLSPDPVIRAAPPTTWPAVLLLLEQLAREEPLLLVLDEIPYWVARDESITSILQNWWDATGRYLPGLKLFLCGSAVQMMEHLFSGDAPLAGCVTQRLPVAPFSYRDAAELLRFPTPRETLTAYGILGGVPLYPALFDPSLSLRDNVAEHIVSPAARLHVEPQAVFASHHRPFNVQDALRLLGAIARGAHQWSDIVEKSRLSPVTTARLLDLFRGDLALVRKVLPVTVEEGNRTTRTQYRLTDNFFRFWFTFIEPYRGRIEFGGEHDVADAIMRRLPDFMGEPFEEICRTWTRGLPGIVRVGMWWGPRDELDVVGLDDEGAAVAFGECKWQESGFSFDDLTRYLDHVAAFTVAERDTKVRPDVQHLLFSKTSFDPRVRDWATRTGARLVTPTELLADT